MISLPKLYKHPQTLLSSSGYTKMINWVHNEELNVPIGHDPLVLNKINPVDSQAFLLNKGPPVVFPLHPHWNALYLIIHFRRRRMATWSEWQAYVLFARSIYGRLRNSNKKLIDFKIPFRE